MTQLDWSMAKRPLQRLYMRLANCPIRFVIYTARLQDRYQDDPKSKDRLVKTGEAPAAAKGLEYDMNLALRMRLAGDGSWECQVTKVQGALGKTLPAGKVMRAFPVEAILEHTGPWAGDTGSVPAVDRPANHSPGRGPTSASPDTAPTPPVTGAAEVTPAALEAFYAQAGRLGYRTLEGGVDRERILSVLRANGYRGFSPAKAASMLALLQETLAGDDAARQA